jgi:hypothetical protein
VSKLAAAIDTMVLPKLPENYNWKEKEIILLAIAASKQKARPFEGEYRAPWLLSDYSAATWITTNRNREEKIGEDWSKTINVNWAIRLPNGSLLTDPQNHKLLELNKRIAFLIRSGFVGHISAPVTWKAAVSVQLQLTRWLVLYEKQFRPEQFGFAQLDQASLNSLLRVIAKGGWVEAHMVVRRLLCKMYQKTFNESCPTTLLDSAYELPSDVVTKISTTLLHSGWYARIVRGKYEGKNYLKREHIADEIGEPVESLRASSKFNAFCRQFEPELEYGDLVVSLFQESENPDHKTRTFDDIIHMGAAENTLLSVSSTLGTILSAHRHCPDMLPEPAMLSIRKAHSQASKLTRPSGHYPFIPVPIGLAYFNNAIRFVHVYGNALIDYYLAAISDRLRYPSLDAACSSELGIKFTVQINGLHKPVSDVLGIKTFSRKDDRLDFDAIRKNPTLHEALCILIGACIVCIGLVKPSREDELTNMKRNCLRNNAEGYYLHFAVGKSGGGEVLQETDRPIPLISAKAIQLLQKLGDGLSIIFNDKRKVASNLFYLPMQSGEGALGISRRLLNSNLDIFCDYTGLDTDNFGRRWYIRIHEMRKWFLLLLFWSGKFDVLDAARWIASHTDSSHIYQYIEREFPGEELPKLEAEYAIDRLRALEAATGGKSTRDEPGLHELYDTVIKHFNVQSLSMVPDSEWADYVEVLRKAEGFSLEPHSVRCSDGTGELTGIVVSFVLRENAL